MDREQHLPYKAMGDVIVLDGDGSRWVRETIGTCPNANRTCPNNVQLCPKDGEPCPFGAGKVRGDE